MDPFLAANFDDIVGLIVTLAIIGFSVLSQIMGDRSSKKQPPKTKANVPPPQSVELEIEEFLRQARGESTASRSVREEPMEVQPIEVQPLEVEPMMQPGRGFGSDLANHVEEHITRDSISQRDAHLADTIETADERIESHLEDVFEHDVGHIAPADEIDFAVAEGTDADAWEIKDPAKDTSSVANEIADMMKSPDSVRKMFIMTEILKRPEI